MGVQTKNQITNKYIEELVARINPLFKEYIGEQIDKNNPYDSIPITRIKKQQQILSTLNQNYKEADFFDRISPNHSDLFHSFNEKLGDIQLQEELNRIIDAVFHWLFWSPVGLQLSFDNSRLVFRIAGAWIEFWGSKLLLYSKLQIKKERILQQLGSFYATSILPSFWEQLMEKTTDIPLKKFSKRVYLVLIGKRNQEILQEPI